MKREIIYVGLALKDPQDVKHIQVILDKLFEDKLNFIPVKSESGFLVFPQVVDFLIWGMAESEKLNMVNVHISEEIPVVIIVDGENKSQLQSAIKKHPFDIWLKEHTSEEDMQYTVNRLIERIDWLNDIKRLRKAIEVSPVSLLISDLEGSIIYVNPQFEKVSGYSSSELIGQNPRVLKSGLHDSNFYKDIWEKISAGQTWEGEICNKSKDGKLYWEKQLIVPALNNHDEITHYIGLRIDDTDRRRAEENLRKAESLRSVKELAGGIAHEFSQPLQVLTISMNMLEMKLDGDELFNRCQRMVQRIIDLVANLKNITELKQQDYLEIKILDLKKSSQTGQNSEADKTKIRD